MTAIAIIPARYDSSRFPGKPLELIGGKPLIQHVFENTSTAKMISEVIVATDDDRIYDKVLSFGGKAVITSSDHPSGTDRIAFVAKNLDCDIIVNVQGDEPLIRGEQIDDVVNLLSDKRASMGTLIKRIDRSDEVFDPNVVKAVCDKEGFALYFSRSTVPYYRDEFKDITVSQLGEGAQGLDLSGLNIFKHIGIYSYRRNVLLDLTKIPQSELESAERLEQLRALENGYRIKAKETVHETIGVDTPEDIERVEKWLNISS
ncbi:MAG: 3-deoxy-manno-octulosonate cytidylyltransferase [Nitrospirota bacterium]|nr:MAG: 3-deoxy-manno-octulosonate cytidylyltransferase [Nitrospirota bacterium]